MRYAGRRATRKAQLTTQPCETSSTLPPLTRKVVSADAREPRNSRLRGAYVDYIVTESLGPSGPKQQIFRRSSEYLFFPFTADMHFP